MQPSVQMTNRGRLRAARLPEFPVGALGVSAALLAMVWAMVWLLLLGLAGPSRAAEPGDWEDLPVRKWDWNEVRSLPQGQKIVDDELRRQGEYNRRWHQVHDLIGGSHVSRLNRDRLSARGLGPARDKSGANRDMSKVLAPDVLRVLLVRVGFETNRDSQLTTISPGGDFMLDPLAAPGPLEVDPPPHGKAYFESHLAGLSEYYRFMSGGRLQIEGTVLPAGENDSYKLSDVADYGPGAGSFWTLESLERLVQDMITGVDQGLIADGVANGLSDYDDESPFTYVIFVHAGSDWQSDINGDSPNDIPTFFVSLGEPVALAGTNPAGNPGRLSECSIIPETTNQDGYPGSIAAAFYHEFGHALGLPDVYDTSTGLPSVGIWDLMDSGTNLPVTLGTITDEGDTLFVAATGVLPPSLSAWCKWYLGWLETDELNRPISSTGDYLLPAVGVPREQYPRYNAGFGDFNPAYPQAYKAGISPREYFLIENRWVPESVGQTPFNDLKFERDENTGVIQYLAGLYGGTWENSGLYDYFMPAGGLLVWHVNADRIASELANNTINAWGDGLKLVEGDGIQDIGVLDAYVLGWFGSWRDPFGGKDPYGNPTGFNDLYTTEFPSSRMHDRSLSGLRLSEMTQRVARTASVMKFRATLDPVLTGFPWEVAAIDSVEAFLSGGSAGPRVINPASLTPLTLGGEQVLVFADEPGPDWDGGPFITSLYGLRPGGTPRWTAVPGWPAGSFQPIGGPLADAPVALAHPTDGYELVWATRQGTVGATHLPGGAAPTAMWSRKVADSIVAGPRALAFAGDEPRLLVAAAPDTVVLLSSAGAVMPGGGRLVADGGGSVVVARLAVLNDAATGSDRAAVITTNGWFLVGQDGAGLTAPVHTAYERTAGAADGIQVAVVPLADGSLRLTVLDAFGEVGSWNIDGASVTPAAELVSGLDGPPICAPAVADVDGDGRHDVIIATATRIYGSRDDGVALRGFPVRFADLYPLADSTRVLGPLVIADGTGDGVNEVWFSTTGGHLVGLNATGRLLADLPRKWGDRAGAGLAVGGEGADRTMWLVSEGGYATGFQDRIAVNGRVSGFGLVAAAADGDRTSEWLGPYGGTLRLGPTGAAQDLGGLAPAAAERDQVYLYPNPLAGDEVTIRFYSTGAGAARLALYNLEGELVARRDATAVAGTVNEITLGVPGVVSGLYVAKLEFEGVGGRQIRTLTLAVEK